jgi:hypothetical protein
VRNVLRNRTVLEPEGEEAYDMGALANWQQVMGQHWWLWALPLWLHDGPVGNGTAWPRKAGSDEAVESPV